MNHDPYPPESDGPVLAILLAILVAVGSALGALLLALFF
jgi:hypothetical protein